MTCSICATIPSSLCANTGRGEVLPPEVRALKRHDSHDSRNEHWECPECGAMYVWEDDSSFTGSGNNDEETLVRLSPEQSALVRSFLFRGKAPVEQTAQLADPLFALRDRELGLLLGWIGPHDREVTTQLLPRLVSELAKRDSTWSPSSVGAMRDVLSEHVAKRPSDAPVVLAAIEAASYKRPHFLDQIAERCRKQLATTSPPQPSVVRTDARSDDDTSVIRTDFADTTLRGWERGEKATLRFVDGPPRELWAEHGAPSEQEINVVFTPGGFDDIDVAVTLRFPVAHPKEVYAGICVRSSTDGGYGVYVSSRSSYRADLNTKDGSGRVIQPWTEHPILRAGQPNRLRIIAQGSQVRVLLNDVLATSFQDTRFGHGRVRLIMACPESAMTVAFSDLLLRVPPPPSR